MNISVQLEYENLQSASANLTHKCSETHLEVCESLRSSKIHNEIHKQICF